MTAPTQETHSLRMHVDRLKFAVATTTCRETQSVLSKMLVEAEARLRGTGCLTSSNPKQL
jgi:hypothetical protein